LAVNETQKALQDIDDLMAFASSLRRDLDIAIEEARGLFVTINGEEWPMHSTTSIHGAINEMHRASDGLCFTMDSLETLRRLLEGEYFIEGAITAHSGLTGALDKLGLFRRLASGMARKGEG